MCTILFFLCVLSYATRKSMGIGLGQTRCAGPKLLACMLYQIELTLFACNKTVTRLGYCCNCWLMADGLYID
jgi:hypothetical protein